MRRKSTPKLIKPTRNDYRLRGGKEEKCRRRYDRTESRTDGSRFPNLVKFILRVPSLKPININDKKKKGGNC